MADSNTDDSKTALALGVSGIERVRQRLAEPRRAGKPRTVKGATVHELVREIERLEGVAAAAASLGERSSPELEAALSAWRAGRLARGGSGFVLAVRLEEVRQRLCLLALRKSRNVRFLEGTVRTLLCGLELLEAVARAAEPLRSASPQLELALQLWAGNRRLVLERAQLERVRYRVLRLEQSLVAASARLKGGEGFAAPAKVA